MKHQAEATHVSSKQEPSAEAIAPLLFCETEAARVLSLTTRTLYTLRKSGQLKFIRVGKGGVRYSMSDLEEFIARQRQGGQSA